MIFGLKEKKREEWKEVEEYLKEYIGEFYEIEETSEKVFISSSFPDEYVSSKSRLALKVRCQKRRPMLSRGYQN